MTAKIDPNWHQTFFSGEWMRIALGVASAPSKEVDFIMKALRLAPGMHLLDVPCGHGRHSLELGRRGVRVTGIDSSVESIEAAASAANQEGLDGSVSFRLGDMRAFELDEPAAVAICMGTSFGMMATDAEHRQVLDTLHQALVPDGLLLVDVVSIFRLARSMLVPRRWERLADGTVHVEDREFDLRTGRRNVKVEMFTPDGQHITMAHSIRMFAPHELVSLLQAARFEVLDLYGGFAGQAAGLEEKRVMVVARRMG